MVISYDNKKHLEILSAALNEYGEIEVLLTDGKDKIPAWLREYELDWYVVFENPWADDTYPPVDKFLSFLIDNQLDIYRLNACL